MGKVFGGRSAPSKRKFDTERDTQPRKDTECNILLGHQQDGRRTASVSVLCGFNGSISFLTILYTLQMQL